MHLSRLSAPALAAATVATVALALHAVAQNASPPPIARVAIVDLSRIINDLDERTARQEQLKDFITSQNEKLKALGSQLDTAQTDIELLVAGTPDRRRKEEEVAWLRINLEYQKRWSEQLIDRRRAEVFADLFEKIRDATTKVAQQQGFDLVFSSDYEGDVPHNQEADIRAVMSTRRVLYASPDIDITEDVVRLMNNEWHAGSGGRP